ncbi:Hypothetical protein HDN1F_13980 [gamma proteobacterium HdN1]|nr:Hypothetical protein HDN1F_13980 [gamma proteobacterium HdN1]
MSLIGESGWLQAVNAFFAHSTQRTDKSDWQSLAEHLTSVGDLAATFASDFGAHSLAQAAGLLHDLGKYTREFQSRLEGGAKVDHATWGAHVALELFGQAGILLAYGIAGHHAGLANGRGGEVRTALEDRLKTTLPELLPDWRRELALPDKSALWPIADFKPCRERGMFQLSVLVRMLFSCLVDADFIDTDEFYRRIDNRPPRRAESLPSLERLRERLDAKLAGFSADTAVNQLRADILAHVREQAAQPPGLFSLTVPTGGGKTLASLAFALDHAIAHGLRRVIYVIPFTSIVEQNAQVFREAFGDLFASAWIEIGIEGRLAAPPLPHHRAYGSRTTAVRWLIYFIPLPIPAAQCL